MKVRDVCVLSIFAVGGGSSAAFQKKNAMWSIHRSKYKEIIRLLVQRRKEQGVTQCQLARNMHLRQGIISKIETCERRIDLLELINYCRGVNISFLDFAAEVSKKILKEHGKD